MERMFGDPVSDEGPMQFLRERGWTLNRDWTWSKLGQTLQSMPQDEYLCVLFLVHEWDFGGVKEGNNA